MTYSVLCVVSHVFVQLRLTISFNGPMAWSLRKDINHVYIYIYVYIYSIVTGHVIISNKINYSEDRRKNEQHSILHS